MLKPLTPSSALSTSRSPSRRALVMGRRMGLASPICARSVGLDSTLAEPKLCRADQYEVEPGTMGDDAPECSPAGIGMGIGMERRGAPPDRRPLNASRKWEIDGDTARRFAAVGYGSYRSSTAQRHMHVSTRPEGKDSLDSTGHTLPLVCPHGTRGGWGCVSPRWDNGRGDCRGRLHVPRMRTVALRLQMRNT